MVEALVIGCKSCLCLQVLSLVASLVTGCKSCHMLQVLSLVGALSSGATRVRGWRAGSLCQRCGLSVPSATCHIHSTSNLPDPFNLHLTTKKQWLLRARCKIFCAVYQGQENTWCGVLLPRAYALALACPLPLPLPFTSPLPSPSPSGISQLGPAV